jgi:hypothetical protein
VIHEQRARFRIEEGARYAGKGFGIAVLSPAAVLQADIRSIRQ